MSDMITIDWHETTRHRARIRLDEARALLQRHGLDGTGGGDVQVAERLSRLDVDKLLTVAVPEHRNTETVLDQVRPEK